MPAPRKVLVIDDAKFIRTLLKRILVAPDFEVAEAATVEDAVRRFQEFAPDVIICDLCMPGKNGFDLIAEVRAIEPEARIIVCTADIQETSRLHAEELGAVGFVTKPFTRDAILSAVDASCPGQDNGDGMDDGFAPLSAEQRDALIEIIHIGIGKAAASLSQMITKRVELSIPELDIKPLDKFQRFYTRYVEGDAVAVRQRFEGNFAGDALLLFPKDSGKRLVDVLLDRKNAPNEFSETDQSAITEVGNILISACVGTFGNILKSEITYTSPALTIRDAGSIIGDLAEQESSRTKYGIILKTEFAVKRSQIYGHLVLVFGFESIDFLRKAIDKMLE